MREWETGGDRSVEVGIRVLNAYFKKYPRDQENWHVIAVEQGFAIDLCTNPPIIYMGRIDMIVEENDRFTINDHKFSKQLGNSYMDRLRPNDALTGYCWSAGQILGLPIERAMLNVICPLKTDIKFGRGVTNRTAADFAEWRQRAVSRATRLYRLLEQAQIVGVEASLPSFLK